MPQAGESDLPAALRMPRRACRAVHAAGISQARVVSIAERPPPVYPSSNAPAGAGAGAAPPAPAPSPGSSDLWSGAALNASDGQPAPPGVPFLSPPSGSSSASSPPPPPPQQQQKDAQQQQQDPQQQPQEWVPYHLDRIDQRSLPLDGRFSASATGSGVNVYIISSVS